MSDKVAGSPRRPAVKTGSADVPFLPHPPPPTIPGAVNFLLNPPGPFSPTPTLSPAYDIVPTVFFQPEDGLALPFGGKRNFEHIASREFERMAGYVDVSPKAIMREVTHTVERANDTWPMLLKDLPWPKAVTKALAARWPRLALCEGTTNPFDGS